MVLYLVYLLVYFISIFLFDLNLGEGGQKPGFMQIETHTTNTRNKYELQKLNANLTKYKNGVYYIGIKLFINLPATIKDMNHDIQAFKYNFLAHSFYQYRTDFNKKIQIL